MGIDNEVKFQYLAGICVNIISISYGAFCGWSSAAFLELQSEESPLETGPLTNDQMGWVGAMLCVGGIVGTVVYAWSADKIGRKRCLQLITLPSLLGWVIIPFARNPTHLSISRFFGGFAGGGAFSVIPIYTTELSTDSVRGTLGTFLVLSCNFGVLLAFALGYYYSYSMVAWILSTVTITFLCVFSFMPETPQYLIKKNKTEKAEKSLMYYRGATKKSAEHFQFEMEKLKGNQKETEDGDSLTWKDFTTHQARKGIMIGVFLMVLNQFSGCFAMINYTASIFKQSGSHLSPTSSAIIVGAIQLLGSYVATLLVDRAGRKILLVVSSIGTGLGMFSLGLYVYLNKLGYDTSSFGWVPVFSFSFAIFLACWGILPLPYVVLSEILGPKIRDIASMFCMLVLWIIAMFMLKYLPQMTEFLGMHGLMFFFAISCFAGAIFILAFIPETKGKSIETILSLL